MDCSLPDFSAHGISQARILEWVTISSPRGFSWPRGQTCISCVSCIAGRFFTHWAMREAGRIPCRNTGTDALSIFIIACSEQPRAPMSIKNKTDTLWYIYTMKYYVMIKINKLQLSKNAWLNRQDIILSKHVRYNKILNTQFHVYTIKIKTKLNILGKHI